MSEADRISAFANVPHGLAEIVVATCSVTGHTVRAIRSDCRKRPLVIVRRKISLAARDAGFSFPQIGRALNRDHSTIIHSVKIG